MQGWYNIYKQLNKMKNTNHITISINAEKVFDKVQQKLMIKAFRKWD